MHPANKGSLPPRSADKEAISGKSTHIPESVGTALSEEASDTAAFVRMARDTLQPGATDPLCLEWTDVVFDLIRSIGDPEKDQSLEDLEVVREDLVEVTRRHVSSSNKTPKFNVRVGIVPTVPHWKVLLRLCIRTQLERSLPPTEFKISLYIKPGSHSQYEEISKQINDKERCAAASEHPNLRETVMKCINRADDL